MRVWMILAQGVEGQRSEHCHELRCGAQGPTDACGSDLRHVHLQDTSPPPAAAENTGAWARLRWQRWPGEPWGAGSGGFRRGSRPNHDSRHDLPRASVALSSGQKHSALTWGREAGNWEARGHPDSGLCSSQGSLSHAGLARPPSGCVEWWVRRGGSQEGCRAGTSLPFPIALLNVDFL